MMRGHPRRYVTIALLIASALLGAGMTPLPPVSAAAGISLSRSTAGAGDRIAVSGGGFHANSAITVIAHVRVRGRAQPVQVAALSNASGSFGTSFVLPASTDQGTYAVTARDTLSTSATQHLTVLPRVAVRVGGSGTGATVVAGRKFYVDGSGFGGGERVRVTASFNLYTGDIITTSYTSVANSAGTFYEAVLRVPRNATTRSASVVATGTRTGRRGTASVAVVYRPSISVSPGTVAPGGTITVRGSDFVANTRVTVSLTFPRTDSSQLTLSKSPVADGNGSFATSLALPGNVANGRYTVSAVDRVGGFRATARVTVVRRPPPTATATPRPLPTATATATATPLPKKKGLGFRWISLWYHPVRAGTWDYLDIKVRPSKQIGIWVQVIFPNGKHYYYYEQTDNHGRWQKRFDIPRDAISRNSNQADITIQLWKGSKTVRSFLSFTLV